MHRYSTEQTLASYSRTLRYGHSRITTESGKVHNFPMHLTPAPICKHFPLNCPDCPHDNLQRHSSLNAPLSLTSIDEEFELGYKGKWTDVSGPPAPTFQRDLYSFTVVDTLSKYIYTNCVGVLYHLESLRLFVAATGQTLRFTRTDN